MPIYEFLCPECSVKKERIRDMGDTTAEICHCGREMIKELTFPAMVKIKGGEGGYPSRRKYFKGSAPYSGAAKEWDPIDHNQFNAKPEKDYYPMS